MRLLGEINLLGRKGSAMVELLALLILVAFTSGVILLLVQAGVITVKSSPADYEPEGILNTEFLPFAREGTLSIQGFQFCGFVDEKFNCLNPKEKFKAGERVYFRFAVETSNFEGKALVVQNYRLKDAFGKVLLEVDEESNNYAKKSEVLESETFYFKDFIVTEAEDAGGYTFELLVENPLLQKKAKKL